MRNVTLIGMPGSGKSTVGVLLAKALGFQFLDTDLVLQSRHGMLLQDILDSLGLERFLDAEGEVLRQVEAEGTVISPGGSCVFREAAMEHLRTLGPVVYLHVSLEELERRVTNFTTRGIAMDPGQTLADLYALRSPLYRRWAHLVVEVVPGQSQEQTVEAVLAALGRGD